MWPCGRPIRARNVKVDDGLVHKLVNLSTSFRPDNNGQDFTSKRAQIHSGAVHSFCDPTANAGPTRYDEKLCRQFDETP
jgi:hypothetical protein